MCLAIALVGGCQEVCLRHSDCPPGWVCEASGLCDVAPIPPATESDAATGDTPDAASPDEGGAGADDASDELPDAGTDFDAFG